MSVGPQTSCCYAEDAHFAVSCDPSPGLTKSWFCDRQHAAWCVSSQRRSRAKKRAAAVLLGAYMYTCIIATRHRAQAIPQLHAATWSGRTHLIKQVIHSHRQVVQDHVDTVVLVDLALEVLCPGITFVVVLSDGAGISHWCCATGLSCMLLPCSLQGSEHKKRDDHLHTARRMACLSSLPCPLPCKTQRAGSEPACCPLAPAP